LHKGGITEKRFLEGSNFIKMGGMKNA
jgi:hypothetical protein